MVPLEGLVEDAGQEGAGLAGLMWTTVLFAPARVQTAYARCPEQWLPLDGGGMGCWRENPFSHERPSKFLASAS